MAFNPYNYCLFGKQYNIFFGKFSKRKENMLKLVYSDICGCTEVKSINGNRYFINFINDASRKVWVYFVRTKDHIFQYF